MRHITIAVEDDVATWADAYAAEHDSTVSRMVGELLRERMEEVVSYDKAMRSFLAHERRPLKTSGGYPRREDLYDRDVVR